MVHNTELAEQRKKAIKKRNAFYLFGLLTFVLSIFIFSFFHIPMENGSAQRAQTESQHR